MAPFTPEEWNPLTPTDIVFLHGEKFAKKARLGGVELLHCEVKVSAADLGRAILSTAFLASEEMDELRLELVETKGFLGIRKSQKPFAQPSRKSGSWVDNSLEDSLCSLVRQMASQNQNDVYSLIYAWLGEDSGTPWQAVVQKLEDGMAERGLLNRQEEKKLKVFSVARYSLREEATQALRGQPEALEQVHQLLERSRQERPQVLQLLEKQIAKAIRARTEQD